ncbi:beta strand repeat-containing protein [Sporomusa aerivorans]|uniref:beta strand repeat-containing protein n=1 Tax=Sporomusa aerivorans TaxID=204936 RepID=UPI003529E3A8
MQRKWKRRWQRLTKNLLPPLAAGLLFLSSYHPAFANPTGGTVVSGSAAITASGATTTVTQTTDKAILNWQSFSIASGETVNFIQPSSSAVTLNRVIGTDASSIYGTLTANGKVFLINPNGILFASGSQVSTGGLVASTLNITDSDFLNANYTFSGTATNGVTNQGTITAASEAVLIGPQVKNEGVIAAKVTALGAGQAVSLDFSGDSLLNLTVDTGAAGGSATNSGTITASGDLVVMTAGTKDALLNTVVNNSGVIRAQSVNNVNGVIRLEGGTVVNSGTLDASGKTSGQTGGTIKLLGDTVTVQTGSILDVSGDAGGGTALIGGAYQGGSSEYQATNTTVEQGAAITADAITSGNGGQIVVWAKDTTQFAGAISAQGGSLSGDGGSVETSGKQSLKVADTASVNTTADKGKTGSWLLDPADFIIADTGGDMTATSLQTALATTDVTISTGSSGSTVTSVSGTTTGELNSGSSGDITVNSDLTWTSTNTLTLSAYNNINLNSSITATSGGLTLAANTSTSGNSTTSGIITPANGSSISVGTFILQSGTWREITASLSSFTATDFRINGGTFIRALDGDGTSSDPYQIADVYGLQGIGSSGMLGNDYTLANDIDASGTAYWNAYVDSGITEYSGFTPIGTYGNAFTGTFDGLGHTVSALTINLSSSNAVYAGLFGYTGSGATLQNVGLLGGSVSSSSSSSFSAAGGLVGVNSGAITNSYSTGLVSSSAASFSSSSSAAGGLVGVNSGAITNSYSTGLVSSSASSYSYSSYSYAGGLVGYNSGAITNSYSTGSVSSSAASSYYSSYSTAGGLVGYNSGAITNSYSTGSVSSSASYYSYAGGLVGYNSDAITNSYSTGSVSSSASSSYYAGGFVGYNDGSMTSSYWDVDTSGQAIGLGYDSLDQAANVIGLYSSAASLAADSTRKSAFAATSYNWGSDITDTGSVSAVWRIYDGYTYPLLESFLTPVTVTAATTTYNGSVNGTASGYTLSDSNATSGVSGSLSYTTGSKNAGTYSTADGSLTLNGLYSNQQGYDISYDGTLTITPAALTVTNLTANNKVYDGTTAATVSGTLTGTIYGSDAVTLGDGTFSDKNAGTGKTVTVTLAGADAANYTVSTTTTADITQAALTVTANSASKTYDGLAYSGGSGITYSGFVNNEDSSVLTGALAYSGSSQGAINAGSYDITASGLSSGNYTISYVNGTLTVNPAALTVTASNAAKTYDGLAYSGGSGVTYSGFVNNEDSSVLGGSLTYGGTAQGAVNAGSYTISASGLSSGNYTISYVNGTLTVNPAALTVTASNAAKTYDGLAYSGGSGVTYSGFVNNEDSSVLGGSLTYGGTAQGAVNAGSYTISASGLSSGNYTISYVNGTLTVNPAAFTVTASNAAKTYDGLAYSGGSGVTYSGFVNNEDSSVLTGALTYGGTSQGALRPGSYTITPDGLTAANYAITFVNGTLTITGRMADPTYDGAVLHAEHLAGAMPGGAAFSGLSGYLTGSANLYAPLTIIGSGINTGGYPLTVLTPAGLANSASSTGSETE